MCPPQGTARLHANAEQRRIWYQPIDHIATRHEILKGGDQNQLVVILVNRDMSWVHGGRKTLYSCDILTRGWMDVTHMAVHVKRP
jgi:hypothetical protein